MVKLVAMDLDGTLTQHKSPLSDDIRRVLVELAERYSLLMVGAGACMRIFRQMESFPIDIVGNYGLQYAEYDAETNGLRFARNISVPCDREGVRRRIDAFRAAHGLTDYVGDSVEYHDSGAVTFPVLGTGAALADKLAYDPDRRRRRAIYNEVVGLFPEYNVFVGGSSSFDMAPKPYDKAYALSQICAERGLKHDEVLYVGDDYGLGGNDEAVFKADFRTLPIDDYRTTPALLSKTLL